jgi:hypothetical protein
VITEAAAPLKLAPDICVRNLPKAPRVAGVAAQESWADFAAHDIIIYMSGLSSASPQLSSVTETPLEAMPFTMTWSVLARGRPSQSRSLG